MHNFFFRFVASKVIGYEDQSIKLSIVSLKEIKVVNGAVCIQIRLIDQLNVYS